QILTVVADNASNNDTMMVALEDYCQKEGIRFSAVDACMCCMPHTVHLAALMLLEGIGAISTLQRHTAENSNYQESVTLSVD
ncbi:hypothetical protein K439DRAFT_1375195, partial [Ramaria rubella]